MSDADADVAGTLPATSASSAAVGASAARDAELASLHDEPARAVRAASGGGMIVLALLAPVIAPEGPFDIGGTRLAEPGARHWFGTDHLGRDIFTGVLYGTRTSLLVGCSPC